MVKYSENKNFKKLVVIGAVSLTIVIALIFISFCLLYSRSTESDDNTTTTSNSMSYDGNHYYSTAYIQPNLQFNDEKTSIIGETNYLGDYTSKAFDNQKNSKLWTINGISQKKLIVEMTPTKSSANYTTWTNKRLTNAKEAFVFLNPSYLTYVDDNSKVDSVRTMNSQTQNAVIKEVRKTISKKPNLKAFQTIKATSTYELYFNNDPKQSLVLQISLVKTDRGTNLMSVAGSTKGVYYWKVSDKLWRLLK